MKAIIFFFLFAMLTISTVFGQIKIGDNPQNINPTSVLELESTSKVLIITRVTSSQMNAIIPERGGMVYNTDTSCIYYYDGSQWINLCDAVSFTITNDPIINTRSTIEISQDASGYNLEIAKNSILGDNIADGGVEGVDIANNSITQDKLADDSVGSGELRSNAVRTDEISDGSILPVDIANFTPGHVLTTNENGGVQWEDAGNLKGAVGDEITITGNGTPASPLAITEGIQLNISNNTTLIADHVVDDLDTDDTNELIDISFNKLTNTLSISKSATPAGASVNLEAVVGSDDQQLTLVNNILTLEAGGTPIDLSTYANAGSDNQNLTLTGNQLGITNGNMVTLPDVSATNELQDLAFNPATNVLTITGGTPNAGANLNSLVKNFQNSATVSFAGTGTVNDPYILTSVGGDDDQNASEVAYGNTTSGLAAITTQAAIDELASSVQSGVPQSLRDSVVFTRTLDENFLFFGDAAGNSQKVDINNIPISALGGAQEAISMGNFKITDLLTPTLDTDAATKKYVDDITSVKGTESGSIFFAAPTTFAPTENNAQLFWDNIDNRLGVGTNAPLNKFHVAGAIRSEGILNSNGTANEPSYRFSNDINTGMFWGGAADQLGFSVGGIEALRIRDEGTTDSELVVYGSLELTEQLLDENGSPGNEGEVLTATATGTEWKGPQIIAMGKYNPGGANNLQGATVIGASGNYTVILDDPSGTDDYIIQLTVEDTYTINFVNQTPTGFDVIITKTNEGAIGTPLPKWFFTISDF